MDEAEAGTGGGRPPSGPSNGSVGYGGYSSAALNGQRAVSVGRLGNGRKKPHSQRRRGRFGGGGSTASNSGSLREPLLRADMDDAMSDVGASSVFSAASSTASHPRPPHASAYARMAAESRSAPLPRPPPRAATHESGGSKRQRAMASTPTSVSSQRSGDGRGGAGQDLRSPFQPSSHSGMYHKLKYYGNLHQLAAKESERYARTTGEQESPMPVWRPQLLPPPHVLPAYLFGLEDVTDKPQTSWATVSSIVNTMLGTTIVALPYALLTTGIALGVVIMCVVGVVACFTCVLVVKRGRNQATFTEYVKFHLGTGWGLLSWVTSVGIILGAAVVYHILMTQAINRIVECIGRAAGSSLSGWSETYAALLVLLIFPVTALKDLRMLVKFNSFGFLFVWYCVLFIVFKGVQSLWGGLVHTTGHALPPPIPDERPSTVVDLVASVSFGALSGMATLAFFLHNVIHTIAKNSDPTVIQRDVIIGYCVAAFVYTLVGVMGAFALSEADPSVLHLDNILVVYGDTDWYAVSAQIAQVCQLLTVYPLLVLIIRTQVFELLYRDAFPGRLQVIVLSVVVMGTTLLFALFVPNVSGVMRFTGAIGGLVIIFCVPVLADLRVKMKRGHVKWYWWLIHGFILAVGIVSVVAQFVPLFSAP